jgi:hypothetical protein
MHPPLAHVLRSPPTRCLLASCCLILPIALAASGCGGSAGASSAQTISPPQTGTQHPGHGRHPVPGSANTGPRSLGTTGDAQRAGLVSAAQTTQRRSFQSIASTVCLQTLTAAQPPVRRPEQRYGSGSRVLLARAASVQRTADALLSLHPPPSLLPRLGALLGALHHLEQIDIAAGHGQYPQGSDGDLRATLLTAEHQAAQAAAAVQLPACGPAGPSDMALPSDARRPHHGALPPQQRSPQG